MLAKGANRLTQSKSVKSVKSHFGNSSQTCGAKGQGRTKTLLDLLEIGEGQKLVFLIFC